MKAITILLACIITLSAKGVDMDSLIKSLYPQAKAIHKKSTLITQSELKRIERLAHAKMKYRLVRYFLIEEEGSTVTAIVLSQKVRTKKAAVIYFIRNGTIEWVEILAFGEPPEFRPEKKWLAQFKNKTHKDNLKVAEGIAAKSGATLSAKAVARGAKLALAIYMVKFSK